MKLTCTHDTRDECKIFNRFILVDANYVISLVEAVSRCIDASLPWRRQLDFVESSVQSYLDKSCTCSPLDRINTSNLVMNNELDVARNDSSIRRKSLFLQDIARQFHGAISGPFFSRVRSVIGSRIEVVDVLGAEIDVLRGLLSTNYRLSVEDLSLVVSAVKGSHEIGETCVITGDVALERALADIYSMENIDFPSGRFRTNRILPLNIYTYLSLLHNCCELSNEEHSVLFKYMVGQEIERSNRMRPNTRRKKRILFDKMFDLREETRQYKERRAS